MRASMLDRSAQSGRRGESPSDHGQQPAGELAQIHLADLMTSCATGNQEAFAELYDLTRRRIYGTALRVLRSPEHAEEVTQEVYVEVWKQAPRYAADKGSVLGWIATMAHRRAIDRVRSVSSEVARDERYAFADFDRDSDEVWDSVAQQFEVERVRGAIGTLTPIQRQALQLAYYQGLTQSQISTALNLPLGTVKTRIRDGLKRLAEALGGGES
jgi:RNA polymerase sigma-70 factor, ECF subfamily